MKLVGHEKKRAGPARFVAFYTTLVFSETDTWFLRSLHQHPE